MAAASNSSTLSVPDLHDHGGGMAAYNAGAGAVSAPDTPRKPQRKVPRPRITLPIFHLPPSRRGGGSGGGSSGVGSAPPTASPAHTPMVSIPMTPVGGMPIGTAPDGGPLGMIQLYPNKASQFMFKGFEGFKEITMNTAKSGLSVGEKTAFWLYAKISSLSKKWFTHMFLFLVVLSYSVLGACIFVFIEGTHEDNELLKVKDLHDERYRLLSDLRRMLINDSRLAADEKAWEAEAAQRLIEYEDDVVYQWFDHNLHNNASIEDNKQWTFWNAVFFCGTIYTTIGYGHLSPSTTTGRAITIVYAIFGIPLFLILLADFGKLFTRGIKFLWAFVRRLYFTGSCRKVRRTVPVQEVMKGVQLVYDFAKFRRPSEVPPGEGPGEECDVQTPLNQQQPPPPQVQIHEPSEPPEGLQQSIPLDGREPSTPVPSVFEVDDEFNLPISIAITILLTYLFVGAAVYYIWEDWGFFESFYFVFISMSTIGFGDFVPQHPMYMMASIVYLVFGLALTSMCINVVQEKLSDSFRQASAKIGATIGLRVTDEDGNITPITPQNIQPEESEVAQTMTKSAST